MNLKTITIALTSILFFAACDNGNTPEEPTLPDDGAYTGTFTVAPGTDDAFVLENAKVELTIDEGGTSGQIDMLQVRFAERMPAINITIPGITLTETAKGYSVGGEGIVPTTVMAGQTIEAAQYTITGLEGVATSENFSFSMMCGPSFPVSFTGTKSE